jgi:hypothetical protein
LAVTALSGLGPTSEPAKFVASLVNHLAQGNVWAIVDDLVKLPKLAANPTVQFFLTASLGLTPAQIVRLGTWGWWVYIGSVASKMVEQLFMPAYTTAALVVE